MANMSYCRFENTSSDFQDCINALNEINEGECEALSSMEYSAAARMYRMCEEYMEAFEEMKDQMR